MSASLGSRRMLDLFCCQGVGAWGYWRSAKFSEIVGVDINDMSRIYPFDFIQKDALTLDYEFLMSFDFIHASPPCQAYSKVTPDKSIHVKLIAATHLMLVASGMPYVIENVEGSSKELRPNLVMSGWDAGLNMTRRRYFHLSWISTKQHSKIKSAPGTHKHYEQSARYLSKDEMVSEMLAGIAVPERFVANLTRYGLEQGIPPKMTLAIADMLPFGKVRIG